MIEPLPNFESDVASDSPTPRRGGPRPQPRAFVASVVVFARLTPAEKVVVQSIASEDQTTISDVIRDALTEYARRRRLPS
jgi:hypothetical protein